MSRTPRGPGTSSTSYCDRRPDDFLALTTDLLCDVWDGSEEGFGPAAWFLGEVFDCLQPDWRRMLPEAARDELFERLARRLLDLDLGSLPERILECPSDRWISAGQLLCVLFKRKLPGVNERLEQCLFQGDGLFDFLAAMAESESRALEWGVGLLYDITTGSEGGARMFVEALRARHAYDLPRPLRKALVERLSLGLAGIVEAVDIADPTTGVEIMGIFKRWREELD